MCASVSLCVSFLDLRWEHFDVALEVLVGCVDRFYHLIYLILGRLESMQVALSLLLVASMRA